MEALALPAAHAIPASVALLKNKRRGFFAARRERLRRQREERARASSAALRQAAADDLCRELGADLAADLLPYVPGACLAVAHDADAAVLRLELPGHLPVHFRYVRECGRWVRRGWLAWEGTAGRGWQVVPPGGRPVLCEDLAEALLHAEGGGEGVAE